MKPRFLVPALLLAAATTTVQAQNSQQDLEFEVPAIAVIQVTGTPTFVLNEVVPGTDFLGATDNTVRYAVTTNQTGMKIVASLDAPLPGGVCLEVSLEAPNGAESRGFIELNTTPQDVVTGISSVAQGGLVISYRLGSSVGAGVTTVSRTVTFTITAGA